MNNRNIDNRVKCFRPDGTCYAVVEPARWITLRKAGKLNAWLAERRESGEVIEVAEHDSK